MYPYYCTTREEAEECADQIAKENGFLHKVQKDEHSFVYENDALILSIRIFPDNWFGSISCYSFKGSVARKDIPLEEGLPYQRFIRGQFSRQCWRKIPSYFAQDIRQSIRNLKMFEVDGRISGEIYKWVEDRGFGFARCGAVPKVFVHIKEIPAKHRNDVREGLSLRFQIIDVGRGPKAVNILVTDQSPGDSSHEVETPNVITYENLQAYDFSKLVERVENRETNHQDAVIVQHILGVLCDAYSLVFDAWNANNARADAQSENDAEAATQATEQLVNAIHKLETDLFLDDASFMLKRVGLLEKGPWDD